MRQIKSTLVAKFYRHCLVGTAFATGPLAAGSPARAAFSFTQIAVPGGSDTQAFGINDSGQIVGSFTDSAGRTHGFLGSGGSFAQINVPGATSSTAQDINNMGEIVGEFSDSTGNHGFLHTGGSFTQINPPSAYMNVTFSGINDAGQVVGTFLDRAGMTHGFLDVGGTFTQIDAPGATSGTQV